MKTNPGKPRCKDFVQGGMCTEQLKVVLRNKAPSFHEYCFVLIAINDIIRGVPVRVVKENLLAIINILHFHKKTVFISTLPPIINPTVIQMNNIKEVNVFIQSLHTRDKVQVIYFHRHFPPFTKQANQFYQLRYADNRPDNVHLSRQGHQLLISLIVVAQGQ